MTTWTHLGVRLRTVKGQAQVYNEARDEWDNVPKRFGVGIPAGNAYAHHLQESLREKRQSQGFDHQKWTKQHRSKYPHLTRVLKRPR